MTIGEGVKLETLIKEAEAEIDVVDAEGLQAEIGSDDLVVIDLRDIRELQREGHLPGAVHMPRGMLEFWIAPESPYAREVFQEDKRFVFYCAMGWRSALACQIATRMGLERAAHLDGGFAGWKQAGFDVVPYEKKKKA
ncbi:MAG: rhodanese-like domain-containing protein [bacterium]|nr:rhodanese-like domain-containing protein [bacterium]